MLLTLQGGLSWATGVWYENVNAKKSYGMAPAVGGGVDYTIRPWVRVGAEYMWSRYRREQRLSSLDAAQMPIKAYGNYLMVRFTLWAIRIKDLMFACKNG